MSECMCIDRYVCMCIDMCTTMEVNESEYIRVYTDIYAHECEY